MALQVTSPAHHDELGKIVRTAGALLSIQGVTWATTLVAILVVPRFLGEANFGVLSTVLTVASIGLLFASWGTTNHVVKQVARDRGSARSFAAHAITLRLAIWLPIVSTATVVAWLTSGETARLVFCLIMVSSTITLVMEVLVAALQGSHSMGRAAVATAAVSVVGQGVVVAVLVAGGGIVAMTSIGAVSALVAMVLVGLLFARRFSGPVSPSLATLRAIGAGGFAFLAWDLGLRVFGSADILMLAALTDAGEVGLYAFAYRLAGIPIFAATVVTMAVFPTLASAHGRDRALFKKVLSHAVRWVAFVTIPMAGGLAVISADVTSLVAGGRFEGAGVLITILALHIPLAALHTILGIGLVATDRQRYMATIAWAAAALNISGNFFAIPIAEAAWGHGAIGSAVVTCATEAFVGAWVWRGAWRLVDVRRTVAAIGQALLATAIMIAVLVVFRTVASSPALLVPAGAIVYVSAAFALRVVSIDDVTRIMSALRHGAAPLSGSLQAVPLAPASLAERIKPQHLIRDSTPIGGTIVKVASSPERLKPQRLNKSSTAVDHTPSVRSPRVQALKRQESGVRAPRSGAQGIADME